MGYKLLRPDCTPSGPQARHPRWLDLARSRHQRASHRPARGESEGGKGISQSVEASEVANVLMFMLTRPPGMTRVWRSKKDFCETLRTFVGLTRNACQRVYLIGAFDFEQSESQIACRFKKAPWDCRLWEDIQRPRDISVLDI
jgi:hypothetical protein